MLLFKEIDLFITGSCIKKNFDLPGLGLIPIRGIPKDDIIYRTFKSLLKMTVTVALFFNQQHLVIQNQNIAAVTFGQTRPFRLGHKSKKNIL